MDKKTLSPMNAAVSISLRIVALQSSVSKNHVTNIKVPARLTAKVIDNNMAFNVKLTPDPGENHKKTIITMLSDAKAYFEKDAIADPEIHRNLPGRISGYNAYFTVLNNQTKIKLFERTETGYK